MAERDPAYADALDRLAGVEFKKCGKPDCLRKVRLGVAYCCNACANANGTRKFELEPYSPDLHPFLCHSADCEARNAERGEFIA